MRSTKLVGFQAAPELKEKLQKAADAKHLKVSDILISRERGYVMLNKYQKKLRDKGFNYYVWNC